MNNIPSAKLRTPWWVVGVVVLSSMVAAAQAPAAPAPRAQIGAKSRFQTQLDAAARLYEELEYEQALDTLRRAKNLAPTDETRAEVALYEGLVLADLGRRKESLAAFRTGLTLQPEARLPVKVSPKVARDFETVRQEVQKERAALAAAKPEPSVPATTDRPEQEPVARKPALEMPPPPVSAQTESVALVPTVQEERQVGPRVVPLVLLGTGVLAGGVGSFFGLQSKGSIQDARDSDVIATQEARLEDARGQALFANVLFGVAAAAAAGAVVMYFVGGNETASAEASP